jgi:hypothetical protein
MAQSNPVQNTDAAARLQHLPDAELGRMQMEIADMLHPVRVCTPITSPTQLF